MNLPVAWSRCRIQYRKMQAVNFITFILEQVTIAGVIVSIEINKGTISVIAASGAGQSY